MLGERQQALLGAAAAIVAGGNYLTGEAVDIAYELLALIEAREKAHAPTSKPIHPDPDGA